MKIKINSMDTKSEPSDDEIRSHMNFDKLVEDVRKQPAKKRLRQLWIALPLGLALVSVWLVMRNQPWSEAGTSQITVATSGDSIGNGVMNNLSPRPNANNPSAADQTSAEEAEKASVGKGNVSDGNAGHTSALDNAESSQTHTEHAGQEVTSDFSKPATSRSDNATVKTDVYLQAEPLEGYTHLYAYFNEHLLYPPQAVKDSAAAQIPMGRLGTAEDCVGADAEDAVQDAFLSAYTHLDQFKRQARMSTWVTTIVINSARMKLRRRPQRMHVALSDQSHGHDSEQVLEMLRDHRPDPEEVSRLNELAERAG